MHLSLKNSNEKGFLRTYRRALLGLALAWRTILLISIELPNEADLIVGAVVVLCVWGLAPYLLFAGLAHWIGHRPTLLTSSLVLFGGDVMSGIGVLQPSSSTDPVAVITYPFLATFGLFPVTWLVGRLLDR
jgi:hypothetical protein